jgi:hypothetical protein
LTTMHESIIFRQEFELIHKNCFKGRPYHFSKKLYLQKKNSVIPVRVEKQNNCIRTDLLYKAWAKTCLKVNLEVESIMFSY